MKRAMTLLVLSFAGLITLAARADGNGPDTVGLPLKAVRDNRQVMTRLEIGYRGSFVTNAGYNPFSTNDYLPQFSLAASQTVFSKRRFSLATGFGWDYANTEATARGNATSFRMHLLTLPLDGRVHFGDWGYLFVRVAPGVAMVTTEIDDSSAPAPLTKNRWLFATDVSAGYAWLIAPRGGQQTLPRAWVQTDVGYGWMVGERLNLAPDGGGAAGVDLGSLALNGAFFRIAVAASY